MPDRDRLRDRVRRELPVQQPTVIRSQVPKPGLLTRRHRQHARADRQLVDRHLRRVDLCHRDVERVERVLRIAGRHDQVGVVAGDHHVGQARHELNRLFRGATGRIDQRNRASVPIRDPHRIGPDGTVRGARGRGHADRPAAGMDRRLHLLDVRANHRDGAVAGVGHQDALDRALPGDGHRHRVRPAPELDGWAWRQGGWVERTDGVVSVGEDHQRPECTTGRADHLIGVSADVHAGQWRHRVEVGNS
jgi:hypothetical protein